MAAQAFGMGKKTAEAVLCGERIRACMTHKGWIQTDLARESGLTYTRIGNYLQGLRELPIREANLLGATLGVPAAYLLGVIDDLDKVVLMATDEQKRSFLTLLGNDAPDKHRLKPATEEALHPMSRAQKSGKLHAKHKAA